MLTEDALEGLMEQVWANKQPPTPQYIVVSCEAHAGVQAFLANQGRDRRRIKREMRKAMRAVKVR